MEPSQRDATGLPSKKSKKKKCDQGEHSKPKKKNKAKKAALKKLVNLHLMIEVLNGRQLVELVKLIERNEPSLGPCNPDDFKVNLVSLQPSTITELESYVDGCVREIIKEKYLQKNMTPPVIRKVFRCRKCKDVVIQR